MNVRTEGETPFRFTLCGNDIPPETGFQLQIKRCFIFSASYYQKCNCDHVSARFPFNRHRWRCLK
ncbi:hypothetical protein HMPREF0208_03537 [Citrobacter koseri]|uniref:Uncharacterized protein n=1 Tax=Citrobacter koseri (strain ATCC BAA-895 / CDC 4225-83 / SGSC4696) TaxID=290338 RepID=A8AP67_CITK8|nr:hypothetical protein CKO_04221 [Citrobacter koseri ATCC BAA-895]KXB41715.1 hypothetical protein HMPREF0208_03537 [Citrobacter koseri]